jgi:hypothetical protein
MTNNESMTNERHLHATTNFFFFWFNQSTLSSFEFRSILHKLHTQTRAQCQINCVLVIRILTFGKYVGLARSNTAVEGLTWTRFPSLRVVRVEQGLQLLEFIIDISAPSMPRSGVSNSVYRVSNAAAAYHRGRSHHARSPEHAWSFFGLHMS